MTKWLVILTVILLVGTGCTRTSNSAQSASIPKLPHFGIFLYSSDGKLFELPDRRDIYQSAGSANEWYYPSRLIIYPMPGWRLSRAGLARVDNSGRSQALNLIDLGNGIYEVQPVPPFERGVPYAFYIPDFPHGPQKVFVLNE